MALRRLLDSVSAWVKGALLRVVALATFLVVPPVLSNQSNAANLLLLW